MDPKINPYFVPIGDSFENAKNFTILLSIPMFCTGILFFIISYFGRYLVNWVNFDWTIY